MEVEAQRTCEECGYKYPKGIARTRDKETGKLLCPGCHPDKPGSPGRPIGVHGMQHHAALDWFSIDPRDPGAWKAAVGAFRLVAFRSAPDRYHWEVSTFDGSALGFGSEAALGSREAAQVAAENAVRQRLGSMRRIAHDSGDGERIFHCPFCGSGKVTGRSDGTVECSFCNTHYTVQIQPSHPGVPQTIEGEEYTWPGQPEGEFSAEPELGVDQGEAVPPGGAPKTDEPAQKPDEAKGKVPPQFAARNAFFVTEAGVALPEDSFLRHLAIRYADDPQPVIAEVRASRG